MFSRIFSTLFIFKSIYDILETANKGPDDDIPPELPESQNDIIDISEIMGKINTLTQWIQELQKVNKYTDVRLSEP